MSLDKLEKLLKAKETELAIVYMNTVFSYRACVEYVYYRLIEELHSAYGNFLPHTKVIDDKDISTSVGRTLFSVVLYTTKDYTEHIFIGETRQCLHDISHIILKHYGITGNDC